MYVRFFCLLSEKKLGEEKILKKNKSATLVFGTLEYTFGLFSYLLPPPSTKSSPASNIPLTVPQLPQRDIDQQSFFHLGYQKLVTHVSHAKI